MFLWLFLFRRFHSDNSRINVQFYSRVSTKMVKNTLTDKTVCQLYILNEFDLKIKIYVHYLIGRHSVINLLNY